MANKERTTIHLGDTWTKTWTIQLDHKLAPGFAPDGDILGDIILRFYPTSSTVR